MPDKYVERYGPSLDLARQPIARPPPTSRAVKPAKRKSPTVDDKSQKKKGEWKIWKVNMERKGHF